VGILVFYRRLDAVADSSLTRSLRFRTLIFWLYADNSALNPRLDSRVDKMLRVRSSRVSSSILLDSLLRSQLGLLSEIKELWDLASGGGPDATDYSRGIYQAIGRLYPRVDGPAFTVECRLQGV
jgi:hypothetical protein